MDRSFNYGVIDDLAYKGARRCHRDVASAAKNIDEPAGAM